MQGPRGPLIQAWLPLRLLDTNLFCSTSSIFLELTEVFLSKLGFFPLSLQMPFWKQKKFMLYIITT